MLSLTEDLTSVSACSLSGVWTGLAFGICSLSSDCSESITSSGSVSVNSVSYAAFSCSLLVLSLANLTALGMPFSAPDNDAHGMGVHANSTDFATIELLLLNVGELRAGPESVSGSLHPQQVPFLGGINSVGRGPIASVVARGRAVFRSDAVAVELFASAR